MNYSISRIMKINPVLFLLGLIVILCIVLLPGCEELETDSIKLINDTNQTASFLAMSVDVSHLIDLKSPIAIESNDTNIIPPEEMVSLYEEEIFGYNPGDDLRFVFYEVIGDSAYMSGRMDITHKQLRKLWFHVVIDDEELTKRYE